MISKFISFQCEGAEWIYDTDDDNEPLSKSLPLQNQLLEMKINPEKQSTTNIYKQVTKKSNGVTQMIALIGGQHLALGERRNKKKVKKGDFVPFRRPAPPKRVKRGHSFVV